MAEPQDAQDAQGAGVHLCIEEHDQGRVATVTIDNQRKRNTISPHIAKELAETFAGLAQDDRLRAVVLTGAGDRAFSAGADITVMKQLDPASGRAFITGLHEAIAAVRRCPVPVIGRLRGYCFGGALELAAGCDMRIGDDSVVVGMPEVRVGIPSVIEAALLPGLIGWGKTREMVLLGGTYTAEESAAMGLLQKLVPAADLDAAVRDWVAQLLGNGPRAVRTQKRLLDDWQRQGLEHAITASIDRFAGAFEHDEPQQMMHAALAARGR
ncbi:MAG: enoyl-CoA hydratase-related protein [Pseudomonadota bacterium]